MKYFKSLLYIFLAGVCTGIFFYVRSYPLIRFYIEPETAWQMLWDVEQLPRLLIFIGIAFLVLCFVWICGSLLLARFSRTTWTSVLNADALTYLPLCMLSLSVVPAHIFPFQGIALLAQIGSSLLLLLILVSLIALKIELFNTLGAFRNTFSLNWMFLQPNRPPTWKSMVVVFTLSLIVYIGVGLRVIEHLPLGGDEPHYLLITHSLLNDHDLAIHNNYIQQDYAAFFPGQLDAHVSLGKDGTRYPGHPVGLSFLLLPFYALGGRQGTVWLMNVLTALLAVLLYLLAYRVTRRRGVSLLLWAITSFTSPLLMYSSQIYPEIPSALLIAFAYSYVRQYSRYVVDAEKLSGKRPPVLQTIMMGSALALLPWMQQRMVLSALLLVGYHLVEAGIFRWRTPWNTRRVFETALPVLFLGGSGIAMAGFYYVLYGNPLPSAPYLSIGMKSIFSLDILLRQGLLGLLLDQEGGMLLYAPHYIFIFAGAFFLLRSQWKHCLWLVGIVLSVYIPCGGFILQWYGAWSPAARYMVVLTPLFLLLLGEAVSYIFQTGFRYGFIFLSLLSAGWSYAFLKTPFLSIMRGANINAYLERYRNIIVDPVHYFPALQSPSPRAYAVTGVWCGVIAIFSILLYISARKKALRKTLQVRHGSVERQMLTRAKWVGWLYGAIIVCALLFTGVVEYFPKTSPASLDLARNTHLRRFLFHLERYAAMTVKYLVQRDDLQFEYVRRERIGEVNRQGPRFLITGPRESFPQGKYTTYFRLAVADNMFQENVAIVEVIGQRGERIFANKAITGNDFSTIGQYELIPFSFELPEDVVHLETRLLFLNQIDMQLRKIYIQPNLPEFYYMAAMNIFWKNRIEKARSLFSSIVSSSEHVMAQYQLGVLDQHAGFWQQSQQRFRYVVERQPDLADAQYRLGLALREQGQWGSAYASFQRATELLPTHLDAWQALQTAAQHLHLAEQAKLAEQHIANVYDPQEAYMVNLANQVAFLGYRVEQVRPGNVILHYYWKALSPITRNYVMFVHFTSPHAKFQQDHELHRWDSLSQESAYYPTSQWKVGELVHERFAISASAGTFDVDLGMWDPVDTKKRLPVLTSSQSAGIRRDRIHIEDVRIE